MPVSAAIYGCKGTALDEYERAFFRDVQPFGFIVFERNCSDSEQLRALCAELRETVGNSAAPILVDQEGGRVARLKPPHWRARPAARRFGVMFGTDPGAAREASYLCARLIAHDLSQAGINVDCAPVLDVPVEGAHDVIGDRAYSTDPATVIELGRAAIEGFRDGGVLPVIKHVPGHGRALVDSHEALPRVTASAAELSAHDFVTFRSLNHTPFAMTAHVVYESFDGQRPATASPVIVHDVIRKEIGFKGFLMSDDISMAALGGSLAERTAAALSAGCDAALHCNGRMDEMKQVAMEAIPLAGLALRRADAAMARLNAPAPFDAAAGEARLDSMLGAIA